VRLIEKVTLCVVHGVPYREGYSIWVVHGIPYREGYSMGGSWCAPKKMLLYGWSMAHTL